MTQPLFALTKKVLSLRFFHALISAEAPSLWREMGGTPALAELGVVDAKRLECQISASFRHMKLEDVHRVWEVLNLEMWTRGRLALR